MVTQISGGFLTQIHLPEGMSERLEPVDGNSRESKERQPSHLGGEWTSPDTGLHENDQQQQALDDSIAKHDQ
jgi:hypothetical protein